ncbi:MAG: hypothetical protein ACFNP8_00295 [Alloprevotella sp.]
MEEKIYPADCLPLPEWEAREGFPQSIVFTGQVTMQEFRELAALFDYRKYRYIRFENFQIEDFYDDEETGKTLLEEGGNYGSLLSPSEVVFSTSEGVAFFSGVNHPSSYPFPRAYARVSTM